MIIHCISDLHGYLPLLSGGDLLIIAGDLTAIDTEVGYEIFSKWLEQQNYRKKIVIAGNHDGLLQRAGIEKSSSMFPGATYLQDTGLQWENIKIWGSPWTPTFCSWYFMKPRGEPIKEKWDLIPDDTDILITHGPPLGIQDQVENFSEYNVGKFAGCEELRNTINHRLKNLKLHIFGHIHGCYGKVYVNGTHFINASIMDDNYRPVNKPIQVII
jgi:Icc-related predicted phosphoesterase